MLRLTIIMTTCLIPSSELLINQCDPEVLQYQWICATLYITHQTELEDDHVPDRFTAKAGTCAHDRHVLQQLALNVHIKNSDLLDDGK